MLIMSLMQYLHGSVKFLDYYLTNPLITRIGLNAMSINKSAVVLELTKLIHELVVTVKGSLSGRSFFNSLCVFKHFNNYEFDGSA